MFGDHCTPHHSSKGRGVPVGLWGEALQVRLVPGGHDEWKGMLTLCPTLSAACRTAKVDLRRIHVFSFSAPPKACQFFATIVREPS